MCRVDVAKLVEEERVCSKEFSSCSEEQPSMRWTPTGKGDAEESDT
jgi:hypothetical protein